MVIDPDRHLDGGHLDDDLDRALAAAIPDGVVEQVPDDMRDHDLVGAFGSGVVRAEERDPDLRVTGDLPLDRCRDQSPDRDGLADRPDPVPLGMDEDDQVLDQAIEPIGLDADVFREGLSPIRRELALRQHLGAAVDRGHRRAQLMREDVEECVAIALADQRVARWLDPGL